LLLLILIKNNMQDKISHPYPASTSKEMTPSELVRKHIQDPNHVITDEEFRNVKLELNPPVNERDDEENGEE
jgi:hypothetical protein